MNKKTVQELGELKETIADRLKQYDDALQNVAAVWNDEAGSRFCKTAFAVEEQMRALGDELNDIGNKVHYDEAEMDKY